MEQRGSSKAMAYFDKDNFPGWLKAIAVRVDELLTDKCIKERFCEMIRQWTVEHDARGPAEKTDEKGRIQYNRIKLLPVRAMTPAHQYASLGAIHQMVCEERDLLAPWGTYVDDPMQECTPEQFQALEKEMSFGGLQSLVKEIRDGDQDRIEKILQEVEVDIKQFLDVAPDVKTSQVHADKSSDDLSPSRSKAKSVYDWAIAEIPGAADMTLSELFDAIQNHQSDAADALPPTAESFGKYLREAGVKRYSTRSARQPTRSIRLESEIERTRQPESD